MREIDPTTHGPRPAPRALRDLAIGFIGAGTMGRALMRGLVASGVSPTAVSASDPDGATRRQARRACRVRVTGDNAAVMRRCDVIVLAVKPQQLPEVLVSLKPLVGPRHLVISIAAGITLRWLQSRLPGRRVIRVMPNLPATVGRGFAAIASGRRATARDRRIAAALFGAVGEVCELPERRFDGITAVSGSGPAYVFFFVQAMEEAARRLGLPPAVAARAVRQTLSGSARLLQTSEDPAAVLIRRVASKRGTTEAALAILAKRRVQAHIVDALRAAARRSQELSWSLCKS